MREVSVGLYECEDFQLLEKDIMRNYRCPEKNGSVNIYRLNSSAKVSSYLGNGDAIICLDGSGKFLDCVIGYKYDDPSVYLTMGGSSSCLNAEYVVLIDPRDLMVMVP